MHDANHPEHQDRFERRTPDKARDPRKEAEKQGERYRRHLILLRSVAMRPLQRRLRKYRITKISLPLDSVHALAQLDHRISAMRAKTPVRVDFQLFLIPLGGPYHPMTSRSRQLTHRHAVVPQEQLEHLRRLNRIEAAHTVNLRY